MNEPLSAEREAELRREFAEAWAGGYRFAATNAEVAGLLATLDAARDEYENGPSGPALIPYGEPCPICGPEGHAYHADDSYGNCITCREFTPHSDRDTTLVPYPCAPALIRDGFAARPSEPDVA